MPINSLYLRIVGSIYLFQGVDSSLYFASQGAGKLFWPVAAGILRVTVAVGGALVAMLILDTLLFLTAAGIAICGSVIALSIAFGAWGKRHSQWAGIKKYTNMLGAIPLNIGFRRCI